MADPGRSRTRVPLPDHVGRVLEVYVNGVVQEQGRDYALRGRTLVFERELRQEGRLGFWRWASIVFGAAGTYRQNDVVDVVYDHAGRRSVATGLPVEPLG